MSKFVPKKLSKQAILLYHAGLHYMSTGEHQNALGSFKEAIKRDPYYFSVYFSMSEVLKHFNYSEEAEEAIKAAKLLSKDSPQYEYAFKIQLEFNQRIIQTVCKILENIKNGTLERTSHNTPPYPNKSLTYMHLGAHGIACHEFNKDELDKIITEASGEYQQSKKLLSSREFASNEVDVFTVKYLNHETINLSPTKVSIVGEDDIC